MLKLTLVVTLLHVFVPGVSYALVVKLTTLTLEKEDYLLFVDNYKVIKDETMIVD